MASAPQLLSIPHSTALAENVPLTSALLRLDSIFDPLRNDPRFQAVMQKVNALKEGAKQ